MAEPRDRPERRSLQLQAFEARHRRSATWSALAAVLLLAVCTSRVMADAWVALTWRRVEAVIVSVVPGPAMQRRGRSFEVTLLATLPDGEQATGHATRPLFEEPSVPAIPDGEARRVPPRPGDAVTVYLDPSTPSRMLPEREMRHRTPIQIAVEGLAFGFAWLMLFNLCRGRRPWAGW